MSRPSTKTPEEQRLHRNALMKEWRKRNPDYYTEYFKKNPEKKNTAYTNLKRSSQQYAKAKTEFKEFKTKIENAGLSVFLEDSSTKEEKMRALLKAALKINNNQYKLKK